MSLIAVDPEVVERASRPEVVAPPAALAAAPITALERFAGAEVALLLKADALALVSAPIVTVETDEAAAKLAERRVRVKQLLKDIEDRRKRIVEPIKKEAAAVDAEARSWSDPLKDYDKRAERMLLSFDRLREERRRAAEAENEQRRIKAAELQQAAERAGNVEGAQQAALEIHRAEVEAPRGPVSGYKTDSGTTFKRTDWKCEVVDASLLPREYLIPDEKKLAAAVKSGVREISGCNIFEAESLVVRARA